MHGHTCIIVECRQWHIVCPLVGFVEVRHEVHSVMQEAVDLAFLQGRESHILLQALQCRLHGQCTRG